MSDKKYVPKDELSQRIILEFTLKMTQINKDSPTNTRAVLLEFGNSVLNIIESLPTISK